MITVEVSDEQIQEAKRVRDEFDAQKTYNKFECNYNWIGILGEVILNDLFIFNMMDFEWIDFIKNQWSDPDFIVNGKTVDVKTSYGNTLNFTRPKFDIYISARLSKCNHYLMVHSYISKAELQECVLDGRAELQEGKGYYKLAQKYMHPIEEYMEVTQ